MPGIVLTPLQIGCLLIGAMLGILGWQMRRISNAGRHKPKTKLHLFGSLFLAVGIWIFLTNLLIALFHPENPWYRVTTHPELVRIFGLEISFSVITTWLAMVVLLVPAIVIRIFFIPKLKDHPCRLQLALEAVAGSLPAKKLPAAVRRILSRLIPYVATVFLLGLAYLLISMIGLSDIAFDLILLAVWLLFSLVMISVIVLTEVDLPQLLQSIKSTVNEIFPPRAGETSEEAVRRKRAFRLRLFIVFGSWIAITLLLGAIFQNAEAETLHVAITPARVMVGWLNVSETIIASWIAMALLIVIALLIRILAIPRMNSTNPSRFQMMLEIAMEGIWNYTASKVGKKLAPKIAPYILTIGSFLVMCAIVELFGIHSPAADITLTIALALISFVMIHGLATRKMGLLRHLQNLATPSPVIFVLRLLSELTIPLSLACRLFGNTLGGMIVIDLLYLALSTFAVGIPSVAGLYFSAFHPMIQAFIFITLTLTFIGEAVETAEE